MKIEQITSLQNPKIKTLLTLIEKSRHRKDMQLFVVEGLREVERGIEAGFYVHSLFICPDILPANKIDALIKKAGDICTIFMVSNTIYNKVAYRGGTEGVIAEFKSKYFSLNDLDNHITHYSIDTKYNNKQVADNTNPLILVIEAVEKPGNLGALLRSADASGATGVIVCNPLTDIYNPNVIRSSTGAIFSVPIVTTTSADAIKWLKAHSINILTAQLQDSVCYYNADMTQPTAIVMGAEDTGLSNLWRNAANAHIIIPMLGITDSLNVAVSASILLYEAVRQRISK